MADPTLVLLILIGTSAADRPHGSTVSAAVVDALGRDARVLVEERADDPSNAEAAALADGIRGSAVAEISWGDETHSRARLHVYLAKDQTWYDRDVAFEPGDALEERERAIGFLVGAMIRETAGMALPPRPAPVVVSPPVAPTSAAEVVVPPPPRATPRRFALDVAGTMTKGINGDAAGVGPALRAHFFVADALSVHAGGSLGFGSVADADARMMTTRLVAGARLRWLTVARDLSFDLGLDALVVNHAVRRADPAADRDRSLGGGHADVGIAWRATALLEPFATGGVDAAFGRTPITVAGTQLAEIPPFRSVFELGLRMRF